MIGRLLTSWLKALVIELERFFDHHWRHFHGLPTLRYSEITPQLFLGGQYADWGVAKLLKRGITAVVSLRTTPPKPEWSLTGIKYLHLPTPDQTPLEMNDLVKGVSFINEHVLKGGKVYVHCAQGEGRGPSLVIAYLISQGLTFEKAWQEVKQVRRFIRPTLAQLARLREFEQLFLPSKTFLTSPQSQALANT